MGDRAKLAFLKNALSATGTNPQEQTALENLIFERLLTGGLTVSSAGVIGGLTLSGLSIDPNTFVVDATNHRVGFGTASPATRVDVRAISNENGLHVTSAGSGISMAVDNSGTGIALRADASGPASPAIVGASTGFYGGLFWNITDLGSDLANANAIGLVGQSVYANALYGQQGAVSGSGSTLARNNIYAGLYVTRVTANLNGFDYTAPVIQGEDTTASTGKLFELLKQSVTKFAVTSTGNVGIGTGAPNRDSWSAVNDRVLTLETTVDTGRAVQELVGKTVGTTALYAVLDFLHNDAGTIRENAVLQVWTDGAVNSGKLLFLTATAGTLATRMTLTGSGNLGVGATPNRDSWSATNDRVFTVETAVNTGRGVIEVVGKTVGTTALYAVVDFLHNDAGTIRQNAALEVFTDGAVNSGKIQFLTASAGVLAAGLQLDHLGQLGFGPSLNLTIASAQSTAQTLTIPAIRQAETLAIKPQTYTTLSTPKNPTGTSDTTGKMMGLAGAITPQVTGNIRVSICGCIANGTIADGGKVQIRMNSGTAPSNGDALTGTAYGSLQEITGDLAGANKNPFSISALVTGLTLGTAYWIDVGLAAVTGGTATISSVAIDAFEL